MQTINSTYKLDRALASEFTTETYKTSTTVADYLTVCHERTRFWHYIIPPTTTVMRINPTDVKVNSKFYAQYKERIENTIRRYEVDSGYDVTINVAAKV